jgi:hypothetical protein
MNQSNQLPNSGMGYLLIRVSTALGAIPVAGATVIIRNDLPDVEGGDRGSIIQVVTTNRDGNTPKTALPAPARTNSTSPGNGLPYATYNIDVSADGFYRQYYNKVPVYDGITSIQPAMLIPISQNPNIDNIVEGDQYFEENVNPALRPRPSRS